MGRLPALIALGALVVGCKEPDEKLPEPPGKSRSEAVIGKAPAATAAPPVSATSAPRAPRTLCPERLHGKKFPKGTLDVLAAPGASRPAASPSVGQGSWVWLNFWAAWCGPCKEELPRLARWQKEFSKAGVPVTVLFLSLDDDERQLRRFLESQPADGLRASYHLGDSSDRPGWLGQIGLKPEPQLPVQALFAPDGELACVIEGAIDDADFAGALNFIRKN